MRRTYKLNVLYLISLILLSVCFALFIAAVLLTIFLDNRNIGVLTAVAGSVLCLVSIILAMFSKPKRRKRRRKKADAEQQNV